MNPERTTVMRIMSLLIRLTDFAITVCIRRFECPARVTSIMTARSTPVLTLGRQIVLIAAIGYLFAAGQAQANGTDPTVVAGQASFSTQGSTLSITNSPGAIIHWQGFSIDASEITRFIQQSAASSVLNRVIGSDPSVILGTLTSNGRVFLINPSGILVGQGARIDVAGLVASTLNLSNQDFLAGRLNFEPNPLAGKVENHGRITTPSGGSVYLAGSEVDNSGIINSPQGDVILAAGRSVKIFDSSTPGVRVEITADDNAAVNLGEILAQSGEVGIYGALLRNEGIIDADQVVRDESGKIVLRAKQDLTLEAGSRLSANGEQAGEITVQSETGATRVSGTIEAKGTGEAAGKGGTIKLLGDKVGLFDGNIDASGDAGGGTVLVGGDYQGKNPSIQNASATYMGADSTIAADAIMNGNGGKVVLWADDSMRAYGSISARGGAQGGDGGLLETSGHWLDVDGININAGAPHGKSGIWLLDPNDITIQLAGSNTNVTASPNFTSTDDDAIVTTASIQTALNVGTDVIITTGSGGANAQAGDITVADTLTWTHVDGPTLTLDAHRDVVVNADVTATTGSFSANAGRDVNLNTPVSVTTGNITAIADGDVNVNAALTVTTGDIVLLADNDGTGPGAVIGGTVNITCGSNCITITTGELSIRFNPDDYSTTDAEITAYGSHLTGGGTLDAKAWVFAQGDDKTYDGTRDAVVNKLKPDVTTALPPVTLTTVNALFNTKDVGTDKLITFDSYTLTGSADYDLFTPLGTPDGSGTTTADITAKALTAVDLTGTVTKVYDGDATVDNLTTGNYSITGFIAGEGATIGVETGTYDAGKDVVDNPAGSAVTSALLAAGDYTQDAGTLLSNYDLSAVTGVSATGAIGETTPKALTAVDLTGTVTKIYDGDASVDNLTTANYAITGFLAGEGATVTETLGTYDAGKDVVDNPAGSAVTSAVLAAADYTATGTTLLSNYDLSAVTGVSAAGAIGEITPKALTAVDLTGTVTKIYDGDASVDNLTTANYAITGFLAGEGATVSETLGSYDNGKDVIDNPAGSAVSSALLAAADYTATGTTLLSNYDLSAVTGVSATGAIGEITPAPLTATVPDQTKIYGTDDPALADIDVTLTGLVLDDSTLTSTATSLTRDAGETVAGSLYDITAGTFTTPSTNYSAPVLVLGSTLDITPAALTATV
ncbi:MAG: filamentous hemagglutinin N-terminal domain-containing protein, partial [Desulfobacterales bacterium]|nr:filamentous hemagglutinin N-terminal domain-containing protein [Desulfobacterales bacterium]